MRLSTPQKISPFERVGRAKACTQIKTNTHTTPSSGVLCRNRAAIPHFLFQPVACCLPGPLVKMSRMRLSLACSVSNVLLSVEIR